mmetsp:Transcript_2053/g.3759  ORF Transcript_2053/g.3759 Transcript_2053/m.3759 type:complete len:497 (+) Transcript_2053:249-1739(+)
MSMANVELGLPNDSDLEQKAHQYDDQQARHGSNSNIGTDASEGLLTMEDCINKVGFGRFQYRLVLICGFLIAADAMELMMLSFLAPSVQCEWGLSDIEVSSLTTVTFVGMMFGSYFFGALADKYGRWLAMAIDCLFTFVFAIISAASVNFGMLAFCRAMVGFGIGGFGISWNYYLEFIPTAHRGRWSCVLLAWWSLGALVEAGIAWLVLPSIGWRWLLAISSAPLIFVFFGLFYLPESARYLLVEGRVADAWNVLESVGQENGNPIPYRSRIKPIAKMELGPLEVLKTIFSEQWIHLTVNLWMLWFANAFCYYGLVIMVTVLQYTEGNDHFCDRDRIFGDNQFLQIFIATAAEFPGLLLAAFVVDRVGRKASQGGFFAGSGVLVAMLIPLNGMTNIDLVILFGARMLITGAFTVTWLYTPEAYPTNIRTTAFGFANAFARIGGAVSPFVAQDLLDEGLAWLAEAIIAAMCIFAGIAALMLPIETAGKQMAAVSAAM